MDRDEILNRNKAAQPIDEGAEFIENKAKLYGQKAFLLFSILLILYNLFKGLSNYDLMAIVWINIAVSNLYLYKQDKQKVKLVTVICSLIAAFAFAACHILRTW